MDDYRLTPEMKGWPPSWYEEDQFIHCPGVKCRKWFMTNEELQHHLINHDVSGDPDTNLQHRILKAMCEVTQCLEPGCHYIRPLRVITDGQIDTDIRPLVHHVREKHDGKEFGIGCYITWIRNNREMEFGGRDIWPDLWEYHKRNLRKDSHFSLLEIYLKDKLSINELDDSQLDQLAKKWRMADFATDFPGEPEEEKKKYEWCYPVKTHEFLGYPQPPEHPRWPAEYSIFWEFIEDGYDKGKF